MQTMCNMVSYEHRNPAVFRTLKGSQQALLGRDWRPGQLLAALQRERDICLTISVWQCKQYL